MGEEGLRERACERERAREQTMRVAKALRFRCEPDACGAYSGVYSVVGATPGRQRPASATTLSVSPPPSLLAAACAAGLDAQAAASRLAAHQTAAPGAERKPASTWRVCETAGSTDFGSRFAKRRGDPLIPAQHASKEVQRPQSAGPRIHWQWRSAKYDAASRPAGACKVDHVVQDAEVYGKEVVSGRLRLAPADPRENLGSRQPEQHDCEEAEELRRAKMRRAVSAARGLNTPVSHRHALFAARPFS
eukprot:Tamp_23993.p1 GENE.Tamp_23993~~Tamp_23993.p1  ORF type:complete len:259 (-),score=39.31 Tamp_23993:234-977(-)